jgi:hypothetical protein
MLHNDRNKCKTKINRAAKTNETNHIGTIIGYIHYFNIRMGRGEEIRAL